MSEAAAAGTYALIGVTLAALLGWIGAALQRRWARQDAQEAREATFAHERERALFDRKAEVYREFMEQYARLLNQPVTGGVVEAEALNDTARRRLLVEIYGSVRASQAADDVVHWLRAFKGSEDAPGYDSGEWVVKMMEADREFKAAVRADLGVDVAGN